jgi:hypothetical protein
MTSDITRLIWDTPEMVAKHYGRFFPQDKAAMAAPIPEPGLVGRMRVCRPPGKPLSLGD